MRTMGRLRQNGGGMGDEKEVRSVYAIGFSSFRYMFMVKNLTDLVWMW